MTTLISDTAFQILERALLTMVVVLGLISVVIFVWRWRVLQTVRIKAKPLLDKLSHPLPTQEESGESSSAFLSGEAAAAARLVHLGITQSDLTPEALDKVLEVQEMREMQILGRGASFIGTVGANAPFLGLTGTVLGILAAFRRMAEQGGNGGADVMAAIAGALMATAAGLLVAIPSVVLFNLLKAQIRGAREDLNMVRGLLVARSLQAVAREVY